MTARIYRARYVLPVSTPLIVNGAVGIDGERIIYVGPSNEAPPGLVIELGDAVIIPGLVNVHTHLELTAMRGFLEEAAFRRWIVRLTKAREGVMTPERHLASARLGIAEGFLGGVTTFADCSDAGYVVDALGQMGARGVVYQEVFGPQAAQAADALDALRGKVDSLRARAHSRVRIGVSPHAPYTVSDALFAMVAEYAAQERLPVAVHIAESAAEYDLITRAQGEFADALRARGIEAEQRGVGTLDVLRRAGLVRAGTLLIHGVRLSTEEVETVAARGAALAHCPASNAKLGHGVAPLLQLLDAGVLVGIGSDSVASNNRMDLLDEARLAVLMQRATLRRADICSAAQMLHLLTLGGAAALGIDAEVGSLEVGKRADIAAFPLERVHDAAVFGVEEALIFGAAGRRACLTMIDGIERVRNGALIANMSDAMRLVRESAGLLAAWPQGSATRT